VEEEVVFREGALQVRGPAGELQLRKTGREKFPHAVVDPARPERDFGVGQIGLEEVEDARGVGDVTDIHRLPGGTQEDPARRVGGGSDPGHRGAENQAKS
jgi:hypothetical protein